MVCGSKEDVVNRLDAGRKSHVGCQSLRDGHVGGRRSEPQNQQCRTQARGTSKASGSVFGHSPGKATSSRGSTFPTTSKTRRLATKPRAYAGYHIRGDGVVGPGRWSRMVAAADGCGFGDGQFGQLRWHCERGSRRSRLTTDSRGKECDGNDKTSAERTITRSRTMIPTNVNRDSTEVLYGG